MERWTRAVLRYRWVVVACSVVAIAAGFVANSRLTDLLSNTFTVPGTDSERARTILQDHFGDRSDGEFLVIFKGGSPAQLQPTLARAAKVVPGGKPTELRAAGDGVVYGSILTRLNL